MIILRILLLINVFDLEAFTAFAESTLAYCLILHDQIITYNPFNGEHRIMKMYLCFCFLYNLQNNKQSI